LANLIGFGQNQKHLIFYRLRMF